jgi:hypothetical protein
MADERDLPDYADLYPETVGRGLSAALQDELDLLGVGNELRATWLHPSNQGWTSVERGQRNAQMCCALAERLFMLTLRGEGIIYFELQTDSLPETALGISVWLSDPPPSVKETEERCPFMHATAEASAYEGGEAIELKWQRLLMDGLPHSYQALLREMGLVPLIERAAAEPRLRQLYPYTSHAFLRFSRWVGFPFSYDLPYATPTSAAGESFVVFRAGDIFDADEAVIGEGDADRAVDLLVQALPDPLEVVYRQPTD